MFRILSLLSHSCKALTAVNRAIRLRLKRNSGFAATCSAHSCEELTRATCSIFAGITASLAALGLILEAAFSIELLLAGSEYELFSTLFANQGFVFVHFESSLLSVPPGTYLR